MNGIGIITFLKKTTFKRNPAESYSSDQAIPIFKHWSFMTRQEVDWLTQFEQNSPDPNSHLQETLLDPSICEFIHIESLRARRIIWRTATSLDMSSPFLFRVQNLHIYPVVIRCIALPCYSPSTLSPTVGRLYYPTKSLLLLSVEINTCISTHLYIISLRPIRLYIPVSLSTIHPP